MKARCFIPGLVCLVLCAAGPASALRLTEFMAENDGFLQDADGDSPDWIEVYNESTDPVNLAGWRLTDDPADLVRWTFPPTNLPPRAFLVVFASGKDRVQAGAELHTNFQLAKDGEYLALVAPNGSVVQEFSPGYPPLGANRSYGVGAEVTVLPLVTNGAGGRALIPSADLGAGWRLPGFDDADWMPVITGIGFDADAGGAGGGGGPPVLSLDFNERGNTPGTTQSGFSPFVINSNSSATAIQTAASVRSYGGITVTLSNTAPAGYDDRLRSTPGNTGAFTESLLLRDFIFSRSQTDQGGLDLRVAGLPPHQFYQVNVWSFDSSSTGSRVSDWFANGLLVRNDYTFGGQNSPVANDQYRFSFNTASDAAGAMLISGRRDPASVGATGAADFGVFLNALQLVESGFHSLIETDVEAAMRARNASIFLRVPFVVADPGSVRVLRLRMKYDDGYVAYVNGQVLAARNAPPLPGWNAAAVVDRPKADAFTEEVAWFEVPPGLLVNGTNLLALHGLNAAADDPDFLLVPELDHVMRVEFADRYFAPPTPGWENDPGYVGLVADTQVDPNRGFYDAPVSVTVTCATPGAAIYWTADGSVPGPTNGALYVGPVGMTKSTCLRVAAYLDGHVPSDVDTHTYLFLDQVLRQPGALPGYPTVWQASYPADYGMDTNIVDHPAYGPALSNALRSIPTLSLVADHRALWDPVTGIYPNAVNSGELWERSASAELIRPDGSTAFAVNCGLRMQGNASRDNVRTPKHSFRLLFKSEHGPAKLRHRWFSNAAVEAFDNIVLRACFTDAWTTRYSPAGSGVVTGERYRPEDSLYLRDVWMKDSQQAMASHSAHNEFVHLYVNGLYWGLYNPSERLDDSHFAAYFGGRDTDWDVLRDFNELLDGSRAGWDDLMALVNAGITTEAAFQAVCEQVDVENLIDYMLLHFHAEAEDWPHHNWYAARRRPTAELPATRWLFAVWDQEIVLDQQYSRYRIDSDHNYTPARIYDRLRAWPEFRRWFGDRAHKHLFNGGALTPENSVARLRARAAQVHEAILGESARWGDAREFAISPNVGTGQTFTRDEWWVPELDALCTNWFPRQTGITLFRLRAVGLYPNAEAPVLNQFGGVVPAGFSLTLMHANAGGEILYTLDGSDPRLAGAGAVSPAAQVYDGPIIINAPTWIRARVRLGAEWSALVEATFHPPQDFSRLALTEIMYNPPPWGAFTGTDLEFLEFQNTGAVPLDLSGLTFTAGIRFTFPYATRLDPGAFFLLVQNPVAFAARYPAIPTPIGGVFSNRLDNGGERLTLSHPAGLPVWSIDYGTRAPWPVAPDNWGFSLVPREPGRSPAPDRGQDWRASAHVGGSPGAADPSPPMAPVFINEILTASLSPDVDAIELFNPNPHALDVGGWFLTDDPTVPHQFRIPPPAVMPPFGFLFFDETSFNRAGAPGSFALNSRGDQVYLFSADPAGNLTGYSHGFAFGAAAAGVSFGRHLNSAGEEHLPPQTAASWNYANRAPRVGPVVINEIHYHPAADTPEFVELLNISAVPIPLFDPEHPENGWRLEGLGATVPTNITLAPGGFLLLTPVDPDTFRARYSVPAGVPVLGPFPAVLQDSGERLTLARPVTPDTNGLAWIGVDEVRYNDKAPWPPAADGTGDSLQRILPAAYGNEPRNWAAVSPTPGLPGPLTDGDLDGDGLPDEWELLVGTDPCVADAHQDPDRDRSTNAEEHQVGTDPFDPASTLRVHAAFRPPDVVLEFFAISNRTHALLYSATPDQAPAQWTALASFPPTSTNRWITATSHIHSAASFFRLTSTLESNLAP